MENLKKLNLLRYNTQFIHKKAQLPLHYQTNNIIF